MQFLLHTCMYSFMILAMNNKLKYNLYECSNYLNNIYTLHLRCIKISLKGRITNCGLRASGVI